MTAFDYSRSVATAERLIERFGAAAVIRRNVWTDNAAAPWDNSDEIVVTTDYDCTIVVTDYTTRERESSLIGATDRKVLISTEGLTITPEARDLLVIGGTTHEIVRIDTVQPGDIVVMYQAQVTF